MCTLLVQSVHVQAEVVTWLNEVFLGTCLTAVMLACSAGLSVLSLCFWQQLGHIFFIALQTAEYLGDIDIFAVLAPMNLALTDCCKRGNKNKLHKHANKRVVSSMVPRNLPSQLEILSTGQTYYEKSCEW